MGTRASLVAIAWLVTAGVASAQPYLYVGNSEVGANSVSVIDLSTRYVTYVSVGGRTGTIALNGPSTQAFALKGDGGGIAVIDTLFNTHVTTLPQPFLAQGMVANPVLPELYLTFVASDFVQVMPTWGPAPQYIDFSGVRPLGLAVNLTGTRLYTANNENDSVSIVDTSSRQILATIPVGDAPSSIRANPSGTRLYVSTAAGIDVIDTGTNAVLSTLNGPPATLALDPSDDVLWRLGTNGQLCALDLSVDPPALGLCGALSVATPSGMVIDPAGSGLYVASHSDDAVYVFDIAQGPAFPLVATIPVGNGPFIGPQSLPRTTGRSAVVGSGSWSGNINPDNTLVMDAIFANRAHNVFGTEVNLGTLIGAADFFALLLPPGPGGPTLAQRLFAAGFRTDTPPFMSLGVDGSLDCHLDCTVVRVLRGELSDSPAPYNLLPPGVTYRLEGYMFVSVNVFGEFSITAIASSYTPRGHEVTVHGGSDEVPVSVTFSEVTTPGATEIEVASAPEGVTPATFDTDDSGDFPPIYVNISTDAAFMPPLTVCIHYPDTVPDAEANAVRLWHSTEGAYREEVTGRVVDTVAHTICATVDSLSPFALAQTRPPRTGFVPPDKTAAKCESSVAKAGARLARAIGKCHTRAASDALAGRTPSEEACEAEARAKFDEKVAGLAGCPACAVSGASDVRDRTEGIMNTLNSAIYCNGSVPLGSDSFAVVPPDAASAKCAKSVVKAVAKRAGALARCHKRAAKAALVGKFFDADQCELDAAAFYHAVDLSGCPACLSDGLFAIGLQLESTLDRDNGLAYCAGTVPFP